MADNAVARYGYHWSQAARSMIHFSSPDIPRLDLTRASTAVGILDRLPFEILHQVLDQLDFSTLVAIRSLNLASRNTVDSFPAYKYMTQYAADALRALSQTELITAFSSAHLFKVLRTDRCTGCQQFGAYLFLLTCSRCCFNCLQKDARFRAIAFGSLKDNFGLKPTPARRLPTMLSLPGEYAVRASRSVKRRFRLVSAFEAYALAKALYGDATEDTSRRGNAACVRREWKWRHMLFTSTHDAFRGFASTAFPTLDTGSMLVQSGISCRGCDYFCLRKEQNGVKTPDVLARRRDRAFSQAEFEQHKKECEGIAFLDDLYLHWEKEAKAYISRLSTDCGRG